jgi:hypothetical protein
VEVADELLSGERTHRALQDGMMQILWLPVASRAACGKIAVVQGLVGGEVAFMGSKLVEANTCELIQFHKVMLFKFWGQIVIFWGGECVAPVCDAVLNRLGFVMVKGVR